MEIFKPAPTDLAGLAQLLELGVDGSDITKGIFGRVEHDTTNNVITLYDPYDGVYALCEVTVSNGYIVFSPIYNEFASTAYGLNGKYKDANSGSYSYRFRTAVNTGAYPFSAMKSKYGFVFYGAYPDWRSNSGISGTTLSSLVISRTATNESSGDTKPPITVFISAPWINAQQISNHNTQNIFITQHRLAGDAEASEYSTSAYTLSRMATSTTGDPAIGYSGPGYNLDKTILDPIPIPGKYGSNEFFETAFFRKMDTFEDNGLHVINGKKYGVLGNWALLDE